MKTGVLNMLLIASVAFYSCNFSEQNQKPIKPVETLNNDSVSLDEITVARTALIHSYTSPSIIDSTFIINNKSYDVTVKYYCTMDSVIRLPAEYYPDTKRELVTHNFKIDFVLRYDGDTIINDTIDKLRFKDFLDSTFKKDGIIWGEPYLYLQKDKIVLSMSVSIPVTDIGTGVKVTYDTNGKYSLSDH